MASQKQIDANRRNTTKSTGPKSNEGKSVAKLNAIKHGLTSKTVVISGEDPDEFEELRRQVEEEFHPVGWRELELVERIAVCTWRLRRLYAVEAGVFAYQQATIELDRVHLEVANFGIFASLIDDSYLLGGYRQKRDQAMAAEEKAERSLNDVPKR